MAIRWVFPSVTSCGFGNNFVAMVRAHLIAETCQLEYQTPVWPPCDHVRPPHPQGYGRYFPAGLGSRLRWTSVRLQRGLRSRAGVSLWPLVDFTREVVAEARSQGIVDEGEACRHHLRGRGLDQPGRSVTVVVDPGDLSRYAGIRRGRQWLAAEMQRHGPTKSMVEAVAARTRGTFRVALHVRMGDFAVRGGVTADGIQTQAGVIAPGERNVRLPLEWYIRIGQQLQATHPCSFVLVTDGSVSELRPLIDALQPLHSIGEPHRDMADALILAESDLVVCSNSTYCRLAVFLNDRPYIWPADTLVPDPSGDYGYLWQDGGRPVQGEDRQWEDERPVRRCFALPVGFQSLPEGLFRYVRSGGSLPVECGNDLIYRDPVWRLRPRS